MVGDGRTAVTVIGLGAMGSALAEAFLKAAHPTTVWNRSAGKADDLVAKGALRAATVTDAVTASPLVVLCVLDYAAVREILDPLGDAVSGRVLVNLTTGTPDQARETARWAAERGAEYLDGGDPGRPGTDRNSWSPSLLQWIAGRLRNASGDTEGPGRGRHVLRY